MPQDKISALYKAFVNGGYDMEDEQTFRKNLQDPKKRKAAYDALVKDGYDMEPYNQFETNIGMGVSSRPPRRSPIIGNRSR